MPSWLPILPSWNKWVQIEKNVWYIVEVMEANHLNNNKHS